MKASIIGKWTILILMLLTTFSYGFGQSQPKNYGVLKPELFIADLQNKMLVVAFGGSEGGSVFGSDVTRDVRAKFLERGYSFLSIGYFGAKGLPKELDRISLNAVYDTIINISRKIKIDVDKIVLIGASRGAELALNLASRHNFLGVVALVPPNVSLPYIGKRENTSSWIFNNKQVSYLNLPYGLIRKDGFVNTLKAELKNKDEVERASIKVENINGFIFLSSAKNDQIWPSEQMCNDIMSRLQKNNFIYDYKHVSFDGGHQPSNHWEEVFVFIDNFALKE
ncbi:MAG: alpha/beta hydrolase [Cyclobacteriaceae bacterium]|nr:alpha/beta hydrolase [Cyclobacteriaceae bacterium]